MIKQFCNATRNLNIAVVHRITAVQQSMGPLYQRECHIDVDDTVGNIYALEQENIPHPL